MVDERTAVYLSSLDIGNSQLLNEIEKEAIETFVPIIGRQMQNLLKFLLQLTKPRQILEIGTAIGFSALFMLEYGDKEACITTIEKYEKRIPIARENFKKAGKESQICLLEGDGEEILKGLTGEFDFIFMDAAKGQYIRFLDGALRLLKTGGLLISDNVLQGGDMIQSRFAVTRRNRTIHSRMREYLYELTHNEMLQTTILPIGDGVALCVKR
ncbi:O-methyltransferase [bacterium 1XD42-8]|jgi:predicted O-methyltransferase YrrM|nr:O-methyltransferase [Lachnospiraceae bacterium]RKJ50868.1 O-methyltransferase [bacterium 1XD42-8]